MNIKNTIYGLSLITIGAAAGYILAKKTLQTQYKEDLADVQEFYYAKLKELGVMDDDYEPEIEGEIPEEESPDTVIDHFGYSTLTGADYDGDPLNIDIEDLRNKNKNKKEDADKPDKFDRREKGKGRPIINYNKPPLEKLLSELEEDPSDNEEEYKDEDENDIDVDATLEHEADEYIARRCECESNGSPYVITLDEYENGPEDYETQHLYYYAKDAVLCEDDDSIVDDEEVVGLDYEYELSAHTTAWVRNDTLKTQYEIHRIDDSYQRVVANAIENPREREFRLVGRRKAAIDRE